MGDYLCQIAKESNACFLQRVSNFQLGYHKSFPVGAYLILDLLEGALQRGGLLERGVYSQNQVTRIYCIW